MAGGKMNMGAMQSQLNKNMKTAQMRERMKAKAEANQKMKAQTPAPAPTPIHVAPALTEEQLISIFSTGEKVERTPRGAKPLTNNNNNNKKKKGKK